MVAFTQNACAARAGVGGEDGQTQLCRQALGTGLDGKGFLRARQAGQEGQQRHLLPGQSLGRQIQAKAHGQADFGRAVLVKALHAAKAGVFAGQFKGSECHECQV
jgi:hypothetical protein